MSFSDGYGRRCVCVVFCSFCRFNRERSGGKGGEVHCTRDFLTLMPAVSVPTFTNPEYGKFVLFFIKTLVGCLSSQIEDLGTLGVVCGNENRRGVRERTGGWG